MTDIDLNEKLRGLHTTLTGMGFTNLGALIEAADEVTRLTAERETLQFQLDASRSIKQGLAEERDQYAAVIAEALRRTYWSDVIDVLEQASTATLAVRDAEKKAEGWDEGVIALANEQHKSPGAGPRSVVNPYRTPQQGEPQ